MTEITLVDLVVGPYAAALAGVLSAALMLWRAWNRRQVSFDNRLAELEKQNIAMATKLTAIDEGLNRRLDDLYRVLPKRGHDR